MGQRLNIEIINDNREILANCYFHWSGYTTSSLRITEQIIKNLKEKPVSIDKKGAVQILTDIGATFNEESWTKAKEMGVVEGDFPGCEGRDDGLIAVDDKEMANTRSWEEGRIEINIENNTFNFKCASKINITEDEEIWERVSDLFFNIEEIKSPWQIPFDKIDSLIKGVLTAEEKYRGRFCIGSSSYSSIY